MLLRPNGPRDIFAESSWKPSLDRYVCGDTREAETEQDRDMISQVREALENRDEVLIIYVSMSSAVVINSQPVADQRYRVLEYDFMRTH